MYPCGDNNIPVWRQECARTGDNWDNYVATGHCSNSGGFGIAWPREPEKTR